MLGHVASEPTMDHRPTNYCTPCTAVCLAFFSTSGCDWAQFFARKSMKVTVLSLAGMTLIVEVQPTDTVASVKEKVQDLVRLFASVRFCFAAR